MNKNSSSRIDLSRLEDSTFSSRPSEITFEHLVRLWKATKNTIIPTTQLQQMCDDNEDYAAYTNLSPARAAQNFAADVKKFKAMDVYRDFLDATRRTGPVDVGLTQVSTTTTTYVMKNGYIENFSDREVVCRQVADIIATYTTFDLKSKDYKATFAADACSQHKIPFLDLVRIRASLGVQETDYIVARNSIYSKLVNDKHLPFYFFFCLQSILHQESMADYRIPAPETSVTWYIQATVLHQKQRFNTYYVFGCKSVPVWDLSINDAWQFAIRSDAVRGGQKKRGQLSLGYYSFPVSPYMVTVISEARDILGVCKEQGIDTIEMVVAKPVLASVLAYNGLSVRCPALSSEVQVSDKGEEFKKPGVYAEVLTPPIIYRAAGPKPTSDGTVIKYGPVLNFSTNEIRSMYLMDTMPIANYYPSCRVADGIVMAYYNVVVHKSWKKNSAFLKKMDKYISRFSRSISWRNCYVISRIPFSVKDPFRGHFPQVRLFPIKEVATGFLENKQLVLEDVQADGLREIKLEREDFARVGVPLVKRDERSVDIVADDVLLALWEKLELVPMSEVTSSMIGELYIIFRRGLENGTQNNNLSFLFHSCASIIWDFIYGIENEISDEHVPYRTFKARKREIIKKYGRMKDQSQALEVNFLTDSDEENYEKERKSIQVGEVPQLDNNQVAAVPAFSLGAPVLDSVENIVDV